MLYTVATGQKIDANRAPRFWDQVEKVYENPLIRKKKQPMTAEEIKQYILKRLEE